MPTCRRSPISGTIGCERLKRSSPRTSNWNRSRPRSSGGTISRRRYGQLLPVANGIAWPAAASSRHAAQVISDVSECVAARGHQGHTVESGLGRAMEHIRNRQSGVICHPTSFPGPHGIGDFGEAAFRYVDWLARGRQTLWQLLPLGPTGLGNSPYASPSAFAGNELLISLPWLAGDGLLDPSSLDDVPPFSTSHVDYDEVRAFKRPLLRKAFDRFRRGAATEYRPALDAFRDEQAAWLDDYATFMALKSAHPEGAWSDWPTGVALREPAALAAAKERFRDEVRFHEFTQFLFHRQWNEVRRYANQRGIAVLGDLPIFVAYDSADVWAHRDLFRLDRHGRPTVVAGVPPDAFTAEGQFWGNPIYD